MKRAILVLLLLVTIYLPACTRVTVKPVKTGSEPGLRYYLPQPILIVTPQEDGMMEVRVESIADRSQAYSVSAESIFASHKLVMKQSQGLLTEVSLTSDSSAVAAESIKAAGEEKKSKFEAETEAATKALEKQETASKEQQDELKKLQNSLADAKIDQAEADAALKNTKDETKKEEAAIAKARADAKVKQLEIRLGELKQANAGPYSKVKTNAFKETDRPGPVILLIKEDAVTEALQLVPLNFDGEPQKMFASYERPQKEVEEKPGEQTKLEFDKSEVDCQLSANSGKVIIITKNEFQILNVAKMIGSQGTIDASRWPKVTRTNSKTFELEFKGETTPDNYTIEFIGRVKEESPPVPGEIKVKVIP